MTTDTEHLDLLRRRAASLARPELSRERRPDSQLVVVTVADERFAVPSSSVNGVFRVETLAPLPQARAPFLGVVAWRGDLLAVADPSSPLGIEERTGLEDRAWVVVLAATPDPVGLLVQTVELIQVSADDPATGPDEAATADPSEVVRELRPDGIKVVSVDALLARTGSNAAAQQQTIVDDTPAGPEPN